MKYVPPVGGAVNDPYVDANPGSGIEGSPVPAAAIEHPMREILAVIAAAGLTPIDADLTQLKKALDAVYCPIGSIGFFAMASAPTGWMKANGATISRTVYASLFAAIGTTFGVGDGVTTFKLPDLRGEFVRGFDDGRGLDTGRVFGSGQTGAFAAHNHSLNLFMSTAFDATGGSQLVAADTGGSSQGWSASTLTIANTGSTETRPTNIALLACIRY